VAPTSALWRAGRGEGTISTSKVADDDGLPAFAYQPSKDATCVARLKRAGAIVIGKTNLDQFATGLVGVRSPYGVPRNLFDPALIPGGSSSGSGIAVGAGLVPLALGTDTAGSGRVPAGLSNIVGLKPSLGLVSTPGGAGVRTLDCASVFALTVDDAFAALEVLAGPDPADPYSRAAAAWRSRACASRAQARRARSRASVLFFGDKASAAAYEAARAFCALGAIIVEIDIERCTKPHVSFMTDHGCGALPHRAQADRVSAGIHAPRHAADHFGRRARDRGRRLRCLLRARGAAPRARPHLRTIDALVLPTMPTAYTVEQVKADPIGLNSRLGTYTKLRQPARSLRARGAGAMHVNGTRSGSRCCVGRPRCRARRARPRIPCGHACRSAQSARTASTRARVVGFAADGEIALAVFGAQPVRHGAQTASSVFPAASGEGSDRADYRCSPPPDNAGQARSAARRAGKGAAIRDRDLGDGPRTSWRVRSPRCRSRSSIAR